MFGAGYNCQCLCMTQSNGYNVTSPSSPFSQRVSWCRSSILSEVSTRSNSKLPSGKNILVFGKYD